MQQFSLGKGKKKAVRSFTTKQGLWILGLVAAITVLMLTLFMLGILRVDVD